MKAVMPAVEAGAVFEVKYPFVTEVWHVMDADGYYQDETWRPGTRDEPDEPDDCEAVADGEGTMILSVVGVWHDETGRYKPRVFFTRTWRDPDGKEFGRNSLRVLGIAAFRNRTSGFAYPYELRRKT